MTAQAMTCAAFAGGSATAAACAAGLGTLLLLVAAERARARHVRDLAGPRHGRLVPGTGRARPLGPALVALGGLLVVGAALSLPADAAPHDDPGGADVVLCLDVSRSMLARDVAPDRLTAAKRRVRALCERARGDRLALVVFAGEARLAVPLTRDLRSLADLADLADPASVARGGTDLAAAIAAAGDALAAGGERRRMGAVVLLTDGEDLEGRGERAAAALAARGVVVHAVGFGTRQGGKIPDEGGARWVACPAGDDVVTALDAAGLRRLAAAGGGEEVDGGDPGEPLLALWERRIAARSPAGRPVEPTPAGGVRAALAAAVLLWSLDLAASRRRRR